MRRTPTLASNAVQIHGAVIFSALAGNMMLLVIGPGVPLVAGTVLLRVIPSPGSMPLTVLSLLMLSRTCLAP